MRNLMSGSLTMQSKLFGVVAAVAVTALSAAPASGSVIEYTNAALFNAAVTGATSFNFEGIAPAGGFVSTSPTVGGISFTDTAVNNVPFVIDQGAALYGHYGASFFSRQATANTDTANVTATLVGVTAIGFNFGSYLNSLHPFTVTLSTGD